MHNPYSYYVVSNPSPEPDDDLLVLFTGRSQTKPKHKLGPKVVDYYLLHHIETGSGIFTVAGKPYRLGPGDSFFIEPGKLVSYEADPADPWDYRWLAFQGNKAAAYIRSLGITSKHPVVHAGESSLKVQEFFDRIKAAFQDRSPGSHLAASGCLLLLLAEYAAVLQPQDGPPSESATTGGEIVQRSIQYLTAHYAEPITMELMADTLGYNRAYLSTLFKKHTGLAPVTFLLKHRIDKARLLIRERQELTIEQIASSVGFQDPLYFSKQFKRFYQTSPTEYRLSMRPR
jgi:AraC-like DNA-binding protein